MLKRAIPSRSHSAAAAHQIKWLWIQRINIMGEQRSGKLMCREQVVRPSTCCNCVMHCLCTRSLLRACFSPTAVLGRDVLLYPRALPCWPFRSSTARKLEPFSRCLASGFFCFVLSLLLVGHFSCLDTLLYLLLKKWCFVCLVVFGLYWGFFLFVSEIIYNKK